ncbi:putative oxidoreductase [Listeria weihenstephanensis FSL R9-0317]|uniref:Oxidoreductase n=1 Tax=Listeria weihenstephanensis TaxID=1006155 RepID=A0A1S7FTM2_9LIST|nr:SDR family oxidoreductase [Listeria weihenstephanensis]AQY50740.1 oxidoreductase [Listeria weihenstephanensis]EUJ36164.1 putative oxidoreductase [Listeria weihenstephanensis FSL R9-0317]MBC1499508.1 SDR family oxidoreductase [Listeria weihenstephanensis]
MNDFLKDKTVLITGASNGLGAEMARQVAQQGAHTILTARRTEKLADLAADIEMKFDVSSRYFKMDMTDFAEIEQVAEQLGDTKVDVLVNCAGFGIFEEAVTTDFDTVERMFDTNVLGLMRLTQLILPRMIERKSGHIINIASQAGKIATPKSSAYSATKFAVLGYSNALRMEVKPDNINVTTVNPGPIATSFFDIADKSGNYLDNVGFLVLKPEKVAAKIVAIMGKGRREINLPFLMNIISRTYQVMPRVIEFFGKGSFEKK